MMAVQVDRITDQREASRQELMEAMIEVERLEAKLMTYRDIIHQLRTGRID